MKTENNFSYNEAITELKKILDILQSDNCDIDSMVALTKRATELIAECRARLTTTETELQAVLDKLRDPEASAVK